VVGARRFLALAARLPAYQGVITARLASEEQNQPAPPAHDRDAPEEASVDAMNLIVPGLIERVEV
jgi:hypothetical protein